MTFGDTLLDYPLTQRRKQPKGSEEEARILLHYCEGLGFFFFKKGNLSVHSTAEVSVYGVVSQQSVSQPENCSINSNQRPVRPR